ncbi:unnamed protein product [Didymodactylos carnosus]|uniref:Uncharacterized protein n=1 Tax=Didymodactylos carnosus TaxID=1234261 RepID=A0A813Y0W6_9BILA|nr:unnamed protein product [Didymodactylos carnosus]CAF0877951.1 unnamed protein product [Didymodactylos carnosus]CAF3515837.1 unnamed protein product [Didymodactylos carnosus]CAF3664565.1 unnamed protein product [Didymodactylos carnosus]
MTYVPKRNVSYEAEFRQTFPGDRASKKAITKWRFRRTKPIVTALDYFGKQQNLSNSKLKQSQLGASEEIQDDLSDDIQSMDQPLSARKRFVHDQFQNALW